LRIKEQETRLTLQEQEEEEEEEEEEEDDDDDVLANSVQAFNVRILNCVNK